MGRNAFVERYDRPNYKLHVIIFLAITGVSIFLATQVEKNRGKANIAALKAPVPIDSIAIESNSPSEQIIPSIEPPVAVNRAPLNETPDIALNTENSSQEYSFDNTPNLNSADAQMVAMNMDVENISVGSEVVVAEDRQVSESLVNDAVADDTKNQPDNTSNNIEQAEGSVASLDQAYQQQNDRFLQTLAKTAEREQPKESDDIKKLKEAIRSDKPLAARQERTAKLNSTVSKNISEDNIEKSKNIKQVANVQPVDRSLAYRNTPEATAIEARLKTTEVIVMTKGELDRVVKQFTKSYNAGDINRLMALFAENASTNDQQSKLGIKADYAELFNNTKTRKLMINDINWQLGKGRAEGAAEFVVTVQAKNGLEENSFRGHIKITAIKHSRGVYITRLLHELKQ